MNLFSALPSFYWRVEQRVLFVLCERSERMGNAKGKLDKKTCIKCEKEKRSEDFYVSYSPLHNGKVPVCKICLLDNVDINNIQTVRDTLRMIDRPFIQSLWDSSKDEGKNHFGKYMKNIGMRQYRDLTWKDSIYKDSNNKSYYEPQQEDQEQRINFTVTSEILRRWGQNYELDDYVKLEDFYQKMKDMNRIETPQEETYLKKLAVISLKMDQELEEGNYGQVKQLGDLFSKYMADSKFRASDKTDADKTGGIRNFSTIYAEVEKDGHIPPWGEYRKVKGLKQDIVDKTIMHIENFTLRLNKIERMIEPPSDTPKLTEEDTHVKVGKS
jgi:hypothetical protein